MLKQVTLSFHRLSSPSVNTPWQKIGKRNPEPHNIPVQPKEARAVIDPFALSPGSQMPEKEKMKICYKHQKTLDLDKTSHRNQS